jgi:small conductance mechanosensitive channel
LILLAGWLGVRFLIDPLRRLLGHSRVDVSVAAFLTNLVRALVVIAVILAAVQQLGVRTASLLTVLGAAVLAVALSLQGSLANFASGLLLLSFRLVRLGDLIETSDVRGRVVEMLPFHVILETADHQRVAVPNTVLTTTAFRNHSALPTRRAQWTLSITPRDELRAVKETLTARLRADGRILPEPPPEVYVREGGDDKRVLAVEAWTATADYPRVQQELLEALGLCLDDQRRLGGRSASEAPTDRQDASP